MTTAECSALSIEEIRPGAVHVDHCQCSNTELCAISTRVNAIVEPGRSKSANTRVDTTLDAGRSPMNAARAETLQSEFLGKCQ